MRIICYPADKGGCGFFRVIWPAQLLAAAGHDVEIRPPENRGLKLRIGPDEHVDDVLDVDDVDVIVFQRLTHQWMAEAVPLLRAKGIAVVVDVDDDLTTVHPRNPAYQSMHPSNAGKFDHATRQVHRHSWKHLTYACREATLVTVSTPALLGRYARHGRGHVLYNHLPDTYYGVPHEDSDIIGWPAALASHPDDPGAIGGAVARMVAEGARFRVAGDPAGTGAAFGLPWDPEGHTGVGIHDWPAAVAELGIGIAPLADTRFNAAKCVDFSMRICTHRGVLEAGEIEPGDQVWRGGWKPVEAVKHDVPEPGFEITTEGGYTLRLTPDHRMLVNGEWTYAKDVAVGDTMAMEPEPVGPTEAVRAPWPADSRMSSRGAQLADPYAFLSASDGPRLDITPRWGRFLGAFVGDGCAGQSTQITISCDGQDQDWIDLLMEDFRAFGFNPLTQSRKTFGGEVIRRRDVRVASAHLLRVLKSWGLTVDRENGRPLRVTKVPEIIWRSPREVIAEFLAGYFEADGSCTSSGVQVVSKDEHLIRDVQRLLVLFGIVSKISARKTRAQNGFEGSAWYLTLGRDAADVFAREIGFRSARKSARLAEITSRPHSNAFRPMNWAPKVTDVKPCMVTPVDLQVEGHEYMAAGFVSHNSWLKPLEMSALGVPWVASPRVEYARLHNLGAGTLADTPRRWYRELRRLVDSEALRTERAEAGREVAEGLRLSTGVWKWMEAWERALREQRTTARAA